MDSTVTIGRTKRFLENWSSDPAFKEAVAHNPEEVMQRYGLGFHPDTIRLLWDRDAAGKVDPDQVPAPVLEYREFIRKKLSHRDLLRKNGESKDPRIAAWRKRQMMRCLSQLGPEKHTTIVHAPFAVELSQGCSVGCWFCAYSAPKLSAIYRYTPENQRLWRKTLQVLREVWGESAKYGFCYWATEPLDNPDYEKFICDFHEILDYFPQTTTAVPLRDVERTRNLIKLARERNGFVDRFSIHSLEKLAEVHQQFSPEELQWVELVTQNEESDMAYANSGKILSGTNKERIVVNDSTIACVSGFLLNMVNRTVQLISPCISDQRRPKGYIVFDEGSFSNGEELRALLEAMIEKHMTTTVGREQRLEFRQDLTMREEERGFSLLLRHPTYPAQPHPVLNSSQWTLHPCLTELGRRIQEGRWNAQELALHFLEQENVPPAETFHCLNTLLSFGLLKEGPE